MVQTWFLALSVMVAVFGVSVVEGIEICPSSPCHNGGTCIQREGNAFVCWCAPGYIGHTCDEVADLCRDNPCEEGGRCTQSDTNPGRYTCTYPTDSETNPCDNFPCGNGGTCHYSAALPDKYQCLYTHHNEAPVGR